MLLHVKQKLLKFVRKIYIASITTALVENSSYASELNTYTHTQRLKRIINNTYRRRAAQRHCNYVIYKSQSSVKLYTHTHNMSILHNI